MNIQRPNCVQAIIKQFLGIIRIVILFLSPIRYLDMLKYRALSHLDKQSPKKGNIPTNSVSRGPWLYLVEEKKTNKQFVMRKMEVEDETVADLAEKQFKVAD